MKTAAEYREMADECFRWVREAKTDEVGASYRELAQVWLKTASFGHSRHHACTG
jgi:hypothetical protein